MLAHARALESVTGRAPLPADQTRTLWNEAADGWAATLEHPAFRAHVRHRAEALARDRRVAALTPDDVLGALPRLLVSPLAELPTLPGAADELVDGYADFGRHRIFAPLVTEEFERIVDEGSQRIDEAVRAADDARGDGRLDEAVHTVRNELHPLHDALRPCLAQLPDWRRERVSGPASRATHNLVVALLNRYRRWLPGLGKTARLVELAEWAAREATDDDWDTVAEHVLLVRELHARNRRRWILIVHPYRSLMALIVLSGLVAGVAFAATAGPLEVVLTAFGTVTLLGLTTLVRDTSREGTGP
ncbi:hypothetical protein [Streptomyces triticirhizae]|uniref:Uncharacterized protein n=1 Tax=Streptomyces triticirhizae TaxID=2483353 RepID=A0A3M2LNI6_9ACTN|nr:hypothetical protein [Streptomyces triticirhizae]RMI38922.1 hypothetical protein EBN88_15995 [Streptomyces triticirhizae]